MTEREIQVLKEAYGLSEIQDVDELRAAIREREARMNALDRVEVRARIGRKLDEASAASPGSRYSPESWSLIVTALVLATLSIGIIGWIVKTQAWMILQVLAWIVAFALFVAA